MEDMETAKISDLTESLTLNEDDYIVIENANGQNKKVAVGTLLKNVDSLPIGKIIINPGTTVPMGYMECDGRALSRTEYADLFAEIGTTYGSGDGTTTFNIPDLRDRVPQGANGNLGSNIEAALPNIKGEFDAYAYNTNYENGCVKAERQNTGPNGSSANWNKITIDASKSSSVYNDNCDTVQPPAVAVQFIIHAYYYVVGDIGDIETLEATVASHGESISSLEGSVASHGDDIQYLSETKANLTALDQKLNISDVGNYLFNDIYGKKIVFMGDSITYGTGNAILYERVAKPYPAVIAEKFGCEALNKGIGGDCLTYYGSTGGMVSRIGQTNFTGVDYLVVMGGTNDHINGVDIGNSASTDLYSMWGAIYNIVLFMSINWPRVKVVFVTPLHESTNAEATGFGLSSYVTAIKDACKHNAVSCIDLFHGGFPDFRKTGYSNAYSADTVHPNQEGYLLLGNYIGFKLAYNNFD